MESEFFLTEATCALPIITRDDGTAYIGPGMLLPQGASIQAWEPFNNKVSKIRSDDRLYFISVKCIGARI